MRSQYVHELDPKASVEKGDCLVATGQDPPALLQCPLGVLVRAESILEW